MRLYRKSPLVAFFARAVTVLAIFIGPLDAGRLWLQERDYRLHAVAVTEESDSLKETKSSTTNNDRAGLLVGDITFLAEDGLHYTVRRAIGHEEAWHARDEDGRLRLEYLRQDPGGTLRVAGHHLDPMGALMLAAMVAAFGLVVWRFV